MLEYSLFVIYYSYFFFFQAEDGIRDYKVTGVQTCALPIFEVAGEQAGGRGPNAAIYGVVPSSAYVAGLHVEIDEVRAGVADVTGRVVTEISVDPNGAGNPVELVRGAVARACTAAGISPEA